MLKISLALLAVSAAIALSGCRMKREYFPSDGANVSMSAVGTKPGDVSVSADLDKSAASRKHELATFAQGCFWHSEEAYRKIPGVVATAVGYSGGTVKNPSYEEVSSHTTRHAETILVEFDPKIITYRQILADFFDSHDPTTRDRQGPDVGDSYRSVIFYRTPEQKAKSGKLCRFPGTNDPKSRCGRLRVGKDRREVPGFGRVP